MLTMNDLYFCSDENTLYTMPELQALYTDRKEELKNEHEINNFSEWINCITDFSGDMETMKSHEENMKPITLTIEEYETIYTCLLFEKYRNEDEEETEIVKTIDQAIEAIKKAL